MLTGYAHRSFAKMGDFPVTRYWTSHPNRSAAVDHTGRGNTLSPAQDISLTGYAPSIDRQDGHFPVAQERDILR